MLTVDVEHDPDDYEQRLTHEAYARESPVHVRDSSCDESPQTSRGVAAKSLGYRIQRRRWCARGLDRFTCR